MSAQECRVNRQIPTAMFNKGETPSSGCAFAAAEHRGVPEAGGKPPAGALGTVLGPQRSRWGERETGPDRRSTHRIQFAPSHLPLPASSPFTPTRPLQPLPSGLPSDVLKATPQRPPLLILLGPSSALTPPTTLSHTLPHWTSATAPLPRLRHRSLPSITFSASFL